MVRLRRNPDAWRPVTPGAVAPAGPDRMPVAFVEARQKLENGPVAAVSPPLVGLPWWMDGNAVQRSPAGAVTPHEVEGRIMRAHMTFEAVKLPDPKGPGSNSDWIAKMIRKVAIETGEIPRPTYWHDRFHPTPRDISDCTVALEWLMALPSFEMQMVVSLRYRLEFWEIADRPGMPRTEQRVKAMYRAALLKMTLTANGRRLDAA